jgi:hypothetical protein
MINDVVPIFLTYHTNAVFCDVLRVEVKEEIEIERRAATSSPSGLAVLPNGRSTYGDQPIVSPDRPPTMDETLALLLRKLEDKREEGNRPENMDVSGVILSGLTMICAWSFYHYDVML